MRRGLALVTEKLLKLAGMSPQDIDLFEVNDAFASVVTPYMRQFDLSRDKVNVNGGAIAMDVEIPDS
jgi:acetyl-CoA C-acetyltransferase